MRVEMTPYGAYIIWEKGDRVHSRVLGYHYHEPGVIVASSQINCEEYTYYTIELEKTGEEIRLMSKDIGPHKGQ